MAREPEAYISEDLFEAGIGQVVVCRFKGDGRVEAGVFLVDVFCLGVKDAFFGISPNEAQFREEYLGEVLAKTTPRPGAWGRKLVEDAVGFAQSLGISPCADYKKGARVFGGINAADCKETFVFGKAGRPLLMGTPEDDPERLARIQAMLKARLGEDNFDYIVSEHDAESDSGTILAVDSHGNTDDGVSPELKDLAEEFLQQNAELFDRVVEGSSADHSIASVFMEAAREMQRDTATEHDGPLPLRECIDYLMMVWNLSNMSDEERAIALEQVPEEMQSALTLEADSLPPRETPFIILELRLLNAEEPGNERLLMLLEPL